MEKYTVIVEYPERIPKGMTYVALVEAEHHRSAMVVARKEAMLRQPNENRGELIDWKILLVFLGHHNPLFQKM